MFSDHDKTSPLIAAVSAPSGTGPPMLSDMGHPGWHRMLFSSRHSHLLFVCTVLVIDVCRGWPTEVFHRVPRRSVPYWNAVPGPARVPGCIRSRDETRSAAEAWVGSQVDCRIVLLDDCAQAVMCLSAVMRPQEWIIMIGIIMIIAFINPAWQSHTGYIGSYIHTSCHAGQHNKYQHAGQV